VTSFACPDRRGQERQQESGRQQNSSHARAPSYVLPIVSPPHASPAIRREEILGVTLVGVTLRFVTFARRSIFYKRNEPISGIYCSFTPVNFPETTRRSPARAHSASLVFEESPEHCAALLGEHPGHRLDPVVEPCVVEEPVERLDRAGLRVERALHDARRARVRALRSTSGMAPRSRRASRPATGGCRVSAPLAQRD